MSGARIEEELDSDEDGDMEDMKREESNNTDSGATGFGAQL